MNQRTRWTAALLVALLACDGTAELVPEADAPQDGGVFGAPDAPPPVPVVPTTPPADMPPAPPTPPVDPSPTPPVDPSPTPPVDPSPTPPVDPSPTPPSPPQAAAPGSLDVALQLGGGGDDWARGLAAGSDGSITLAAASGPHRDLARNPIWNSVVDPGDQPTLAIARLDRTGRRMWEREFPTGGAVSVDAIAQGPAGRAFVAVHASLPATLDLGGGRVRGTVVVELTAEGRFARQHVFDGTVSSLAVGDDGSLFVATAAPNALSRIRSTGERSWTRNDVRGSGAPLVAVAASGGAVVSWPSIESHRGRTTLERLTSSGSTVWKAVLPAEVNQLAVTADGAVVASGAFIGAVEYGATSVRWDGPGVAGHVTLTDAAGHPLWIRERPGKGLGPLAVRQNGDIAILNMIGPSDVYPLPRWPEMCGPELVIWDLTAAVRSRSRLARCTPQPAAALDPPWWIAVVAAPSGDLWLLGDATAPFELAGRSRVPSGRDMFLGHVAP